MLFLRTLPQPFQPQFHEKFGNDLMVHFLYLHKCYRLRTEISRRGGRVFDQELLKKELREEGVEGDDINCVNDLLLLKHLKY